MLPFTSGRGNEWQGLRVAGVTSGKAFKICQYVSSWGTSHHAQFNTWNSQYVPCLSQAPIIAMFKSLLTQKNKGYLPLPSFKWYLFQNHYVCQNREGGSTECQSRLVACNLGYQTREHWTLSWSERVTWQLQNVFFQKIIWLTSFCEPTVTIRWTCSQAGQEYPSIQSIHHLQVPIDYICLANLRGSCTKKNS